MIIWEGLVVENEATCKGFRFPAETISHAVWLYHRFPLSYREVEKLLLVRGIVVSDETIRAWCDRFGPQDAAGLRRRRPQAGDKRHLDEAFIKINGMRHYLWRAVDQDGNIPGHPGPVPAGREGRQAVMAKLMKKQYRVPRVLVTEQAITGVSTAV
ncbi:DDE-type integrase/transposase/recombinase [Streptomyces fructofermentans]|uniref:DDE-type integrase/transposase/recombinase n=1 Tax=Streptomyces fructofermentans TaxID=152141 RepID=UPI0033C086D6